MFKACLFISSVLALLLFNSGKAEETKKRQLLITGCSRSGTAYITQVLQQAGLRVKHEKDGKDGVVSWTMAINTNVRTWCPASNKYRFSCIFHQVRDPLKTIASVSKEPLDCWEYICMHIPEINLEDPPIVRAAKYWYYWNKLAEKKAHWTYRIEDIDNVWEEFCRRLGQDLDKQALQGVPRDLNTRGYTDKYTWSELQKAIDIKLYRKIHYLAKRYGYPTED